MDITYLGLDGAFAPQKAIDGSAIQRHNHKRGLHGGYYVVIPTKVPANLEALLEKADGVKKAHIAELAKDKEAQPVEAQAVEAKPAKGKD